MRRWRRWLSKWWWAIYLALLVVSHWVQGSFSSQADPRDPNTFDRSVVTIDVPTATGPAPIDFAYIEHAPTPTDPTRPAVVLLHGSPGNARSLSDMGALLARPTDNQLDAHSGYRTLAADLPGFGYSTGYIPDYSISFHADSVIAWLDAVDVERAHFVGFSLGGGVILHVAERRPDLIASLTLLAAVGAEETEGSGRHWFEQLKYAIGYGALVVAPEAVPHFGLLGSRQPRHAFLRNFFDTDQRPLRALLETNEHPMLILHGRNDPLIAPWVAEFHHEITPNSRLLMLDDDHFMPFLRPERTTAALRPFLEQHDDPTAPVRTDAEYEVEPSVHPFGPFGANIERRVRLAPPGLAIALIAIASLFAPRLALVVAGLLIPGAYLDIGVVLVGVLIGRAVRTRLRRPVATFFRALGALIFVAFILGPVAFALVRALDPPLASMAVLLAPIVGYAVLALVPRGFTRRGRQRLHASFRKRVHHEFWPAWLLYLPLAPYVVWLSIRHRNPLVFTAANPGVPAGGGLVGESKHEILAGLGATDVGRAAVLHYAFIEAGPPEARAARAVRAGETDPDLGGWPVICKPELGWRGASVRLCRNADDIRRYFDAVDRPSIVQRYHPGPEEAGVFWIRDPAGIAEPARASAGSIYAVTRKHFPTITGDGVRTLEQLVMDSPRLRLQERAFRARHAEHWRDVVPRGKTRRLVQAGNHFQGCRFTDGADLITPELEAAIDAIARGYRGPTGAPLDFGRFDVRYKNDESLRRGEAFGIVELNGSTSEATNIYDPERSTLWAYRVLFGQWKRLYALGAARRAAGARPMRSWELIAMLWHYWRKPRTPPEAD